MRDLASTPGREGRYPNNPSTIWRWVQAGKFPQPVKLAGGTTAWPSDAIEQWETERGFAPRASILAAAQASQAKRGKGAGDGSPTSRPHPRTGSPRGAT